MVHAAQSSGSRRSPEPCPACLYSRPAGLRAASAGPGPHGLLPGERSKGLAAQLGAPAAAAPPLTAGPAAAAYAPASCRTLRYGRRDRRGGAQPRPPDCCWPCSLPLPSSATPLCACNRVLLPLARTATCESQIPPGSVPHIPPLQRYRICREHRDAPCIVIQGVDSRFCQQVGREAARGVRCSPQTRQNARVSRTAGPSRAPHPRAAAVHTFPPPSPTLFPGSAASSTPSSTLWATDAPARIGWTSMQCGASAPPLARPAA